jgi:SPP1 family predicted phage head-tail adaptor
MAGGLTLAVGGQQRRKLTAGDMRERVVVQSMTTVADGGGGLTETWATFQTLWARVAPVSGREVEASGRLTSVETYLIYIRYRTDILTGMRIIWNGKTLNIRSVDNRDEHREFLTMECESGIAT